MYDLILALSNEKIKKTLFFENLKKEDESFDDLFMSITINANMDFTHITES